MRFWHPEVMDMTKARKVDLFEWEAVDPDRSWVNQGLCRNEQPAIFFPPRGNGTTAAAKAVCAECPVAARCLQYALNNEEPLGVWGGKSAREREMMLGKRARKRPASMPKRKNYADDEIDLAEMCDGLVRALTLIKERVAS